MKKYSSLFLKAGTFSLVFIGAIQVFSQSAPITAPTTISEWSVPTRVAPGNNALAPLNTGSSWQEKYGTLKVNGGLHSISSGGNYFSNETRVGWTGLGSLMLGVNGKIGSVQYCDDNGQNCLRATDFGDIGPAGPAGPDSTAQMPSGGVVAFSNVTSCPSGWSEYVEVQGRYIVGVNPGGQVGRQVGTALNDRQAVATGAHTHTYTYTFSPTPPTYVGYTNVSSTFALNQMGLTSGTTRAAGAGATNAPYVQYLMCRKN